MARENNGDYQIDFDHEALKQFSEALRKATENIQNAFENISSELNRALTEATWPFLEQQAKMQENIENLPDFYVVLAEHGWYLPLSSPFSLSEINELANKLNNGMIDEVNKSMGLLIENSIDNIENSLINNFPHRSKPIKAAIEAHKEKKYDLSVPVFLAQSDGICKELVERNFFGSNRKTFKPHTYDWAEQFEVNSLYGILTEPLKHKGGLNKHHSESNLIGITRHSVLHGENSDYGNSINSNKTLSLLYYIGDIVFRAKRRVENNKGS